MIRIAVFASGNGTNAENIARTFNEGNRIRLELVLTNRRNAGVGRRMEPFGIETIYQPNSVWDNEPEAITAILHRHRIDLIVLAGFMHYVSPVILDAYPGRVLNIHPSLLPAYGGVGMYGHHVHEAVVAAGEHRSGVTVHLVTPEMDKGEIVMQQEVEVTPEDTAETLEAKIHPVEYELYPRAIAKVCARIERETAPETALPAAAAAPRPARPTPDEEWAETLKVDFDEAEAKRRGAEAQRRSEEARRDLGQRHRAAAVGKPLGNPAAPAAEEPMPPTHMIWSILVTLCCCVPGIVAIIFSAAVSSRYYAGDIEGAKRASRTAEIWIVAAFIAGVLGATFFMPLYMISHAF